MVRPTEYLGLWSGPLSRIRSPCRAFHGITSGGRAADLGAGSPAAMCLARMVSGERVATNATPSAGSCCRPCEHPGAAMRDDALVTHGLLQTVRCLFEQRTRARAGRPISSVE